MEKQYNIVILILMLMPTIFVQADKIQETEQWQYMSNKQLLNETVVEVIQYKHNLEDLVPYIAVAIINTTRSVNLPLKFSTVDLSYNNDSFLLYVTQEGGIPLFTTQKLTGTIYTLLINEVPIYKINPSPSDAIATADTVTFDRFIMFNNISEQIGTNVYIQEKFIVSTNNVIADQIRNYTITRVSLNLYPESFNNNTKLLSINSKATQITWDARYKVPTYVGQTEPVKTSDDVSLSQLDNFVEYFLVINNTQTAISPEIRVYFPLLVFVSLVIMNRCEKYLEKFKSYYDSEKH